MSNEENQDTTFNNVRGTPRGGPRGMAPRGRVRGVQNNNRINRNYFGFPRRGFRRNQFRNNQFRFNRFRRTQNYRRIYISNLNPFVNTQTLRRLFSRHGRILRCNVNYNRNGTSRRTAFVMFAFPDGARRALNYWNRFMYRGYTMNVSYRRPFNFGFRNFGFRRFGFNNNNFRRGQRRMIFRRNPQRRTALRRRRN